MQGLQITAELAECRRGTPALVDADALRALCGRAAQGAGLTVVGEAFHGFAPERGEPRGVTGVLLLAQSHLAVHTWPELDAVTLDVYVCHRPEDNSARAEAAIDALVAAFEPGRVARRAWPRGFLAADEARPATAVRAEPPLRIDRTAAAPSPDAVHATQGAHDPAARDA